MTPSAVRETAGELSPGRRGRRTKALAAGWLLLLVVTVLLGRLVLAVPSIGHADLHVQAHLQPASPGVRRLAAVVTVLGSQPAAVLGALIVSAVLHRRRRALRVVPALTYVGVQGLVYAAKLLVGRSGPAHRVVAGLHDHSFPSGHSASAAALFIGTALVLPLNGAATAWIRRWALVGATLLAGAVAASRVVLDVHWTSDVVAGFAVGTAWAALVVTVCGRPHRDRPAAGEPVSL